MDKLKMLGIAELTLKKTTRISGVEKQRAAIARAFINDPHIIMADEPPGNLAKNNSEIAFYLKRLAEEFN